MYFGTFSMEGSTIYLRAREPGKMNARQTAEVDPTN